METFSVTEDATGKQSAFDPEAQNDYKSRDF
jgi:hypothetical protein